MVCGGLRRGVAPDFAPLFRSANLSPADSARQRAGDVCEYRASDNGSSRHEPHGRCADSPGTDSAESLFVVPIVANFAPPSLAEAIA